MLTCSAGRICKPAGYDWLIVWISMSIVDGKPYSGWLSIWSRVNCSVLTRAPVLPIHYPAWSAVLQQLDEAHPAAAAHDWWLLLQEKMAQEPVRIVLPAVYKPDENALHSAGRNWGEYACPAAGLLPRHLDFP